MATYEIKGIVRIGRMRDTIGDSKVVRVREIEKKKKIKMEDILKFGSYEEAAFVAKKMSIEAELGQRVYIIAHAGRGKRLEYLVTVDKIDTPEEYWLNGKQSF